MIFVLKSSRIIFLANLANSGQSRPIQANPDNSGLFRDNPRQFRPISMPTWANPRQCGPIRANQGRFFYYVKSNHGVVILPHFITKKIHDNKIIHRFYFFAQDFPGIAQNGLDWPGLA